MTRDALSVGIIHVLASFAATSADTVVPLVRVLALKAAHVADTIHPGIFMPATHIAIFTPALITSIVILIVVIAELAASVANAFHEMVEALHTADRA